VVYRFGLENRRRGNPTVGSNPTSSANHLSICYYFRSSARNPRFYGALASSIPVKDAIFRHNLPGSGDASLEGASGASVSGRKISLRAGNLQGINRGRTGLTIQPSGCVGV
jgi:hypothetical protein